ncbi:MAG: hypothetical protein ACKPKO_14470 [Candidatus Fonsibacter sp.]
MTISSLVSFHILFRPIPLILHSLNNLSLLCNDRSQQFSSSITSKLNADLCFDHYRAMRNNSKSVI